MVQAESKGASPHQRLSDPPWTPFQYSSSPSGTNDVVFVAETRLLLTPNRN